MANEELSNINNRKVYKLNNLNDALFKLDELFKSFGLDIDFNYEESKAFIRSNGKEKKMKKGDEAYYIELDKSLIGFSFRTMSSFFNYGAIIDIIVSKGNDLKYIKFCQGGSFDGFDKPYVIYASYVNGVINQVFSDGLFFEVTNGNTINFLLAKLMKEWGLSLSRHFPIKLNYNAFGCGVKGERLRIAEYPDIHNLYLPTASLDIINNLKGHEFITYVDHGYSAYGEYTYNLKPHLKIDDTRLAYYSKFGTSTIVDPNSPNNVVKFPDERINEFSLSIITKDEAKELYDKVIEEMKEERAYAYLVNYYGKLIRSIKACQNGESTGTYVEPTIQSLELK